MLAGSMPIKCADHDAVKELSKALARKVKKATLPGAVSSPAFSRSRSVMVRKSVPYAL